MNALEALAMASRWSGLQRLVVTRTLERCAYPRWSRRMYRWNTKQECVVCGSVYVTGTEKGAQGRDPLAHGMLSESRQKDIAASSILVEGSSATAKGKERASENRAVPTVCFIGEQVINNDS